MRNTLLRGLAAAAAAAWLSACATTPGSVIVEDTTAMRAGVSAVREQSRTAFTAANRLALDQDIEALVLNGKDLSEGAFVPILAQQSIDNWSDDLVVLDTYAASLQKLAGPGQSQATGTALQALGNQLATGATQLKISPGVQALGVTFGKALVQARAEAKATEAMRTADPAFQDMVRGMADAIGATASKPGTVQFAVNTNWTTSLTRLEGEYKILRGPDPSKTTEARRRAIKLYVSAMEARRAQLRELTLVHDSLLALGEVHAAAAAGKPGDAAFWVTRLNTWADEVKTHAAAAKKAQDEANK